MLAKSGDRGSFVTAHLAVDYAERDLRARRQE